MKKLDLGVKPSAKTARSAHRTVDQLPQEMNQLLLQWTGVNPQFKTLKATNEALSKQIAPMIRSLYFEEFAGVQPESSTMIVNVGGRQVKLITKNRYTTSVTDESPLVNSLGEAFVSENFRQATVLKIELEKVPEEKQEAFAQGILALAQSMGVDEAVSASQCVQPVPGFHERRTFLLNPEQNRTVDRVLPVTAYPQM